MRLAAVVGALLALAACIPPKNSSLPVLYDVPEFRLTAQDGQPFDSKVLAGKIWVADFIYTTCPGPCPRMTSQMHEVQTAVRTMADVRFVSFTVDPAHDTPPVLAEYAKLHRADPARWYFLTGSVADLQKLDRDTFKLGNIDASLQHSTRFVLVDQKTRIRGYYDTSEAGSIRKVIEDINALARDGS